MEDCEVRMQILERQVISHNEAIHGTNQEPGLLERTRSIEKSRILFWMLAANIAAMLGHGLWQFLFG